MLEAWGIRLLTSAATTFHEGFENAPKVTHSSDCGGSEVQPKVGHPNSRNPQEVRSSRAETRAMISAKQLRWPRRLGQNSPGIGLWISKRGFVIQSSAHVWHHPPVRWTCLLLLLLLLSGVQTPADPANPLSITSHVLEVAGDVEVQKLGQATWQRATNGLPLTPGDRLRTRAQSRAAVQFSDRSILRLNESTTLEIQPPRRAEKNRFRLPFGSLFFFNRGKPSDIEFETPVVSGAIRGTEFMLEAAEANGATRLALLDGAVELSSADATVSMQSGEQARIEPGQPPVKSPLLEVASLVQWALYYPAVASPEDFTFTTEDRATLSSALTIYRSGDLLAAHQALADVPPGSNARELFRAALELSVGRVDVAETRLGNTRSNAPVARALREIIALVRGNSSTNELPAPGHTASEWLARSYTLQSQFRLHAALAAAQQAASLAPSFGFAHARFAELEMMLEHRREAREALRRALELSPGLPQAHALHGFLRLDDHDPRAALAAFDQAIALDSALGNAWLGRGLAQLRLHQRNEALKSIQTAAALEPRRAMMRSYLGKAFSAAGETTLAEKDFRLGKELDPGDPTAWLYSALHQWQQNRPNRAVRELEHSTALNDNRQLFRSRLGLDRDRAVRSANLAALYADAGLAEVSLHSAARAVNDDYANFSGHLFLANSHQALENPNRFDLRYESTRFSELLVANLLAPAGAGNLSQLLSQQEHLQLFDTRPIGLSTLSSYRSSGDWQQLATVFGSLDGFSYALDGAYTSQHGQEINDWFERTDLSLQLKQRLNARDDLYFQVSVSDGDSGDVARHYDPIEAHPRLRVSEEQRPNLYAGWHRAWSPANHTLLLFSRLTDDFTLRDDAVGVFHLQPDVVGTARLSTPLGGYGAKFASDFTLYSAELQQLWQSERQTIIAGGRLQSGTVESDGELTRPLTGTISDAHIDERLHRANGYLYHHWQILDPLRLIGGVSYDHLTFPRNADSLPLTGGEQTRDLLAPKAGFLLTPWRNGSLRGAYTRSLGGLYFDNSVRLEPTQVGGFNQSFRSLLPESSAGLVPGTTFDTANLAFDQSFSGRTYLGVETAWLHSEGDRTIGVTTGPLPSPLPGAAASTRQDLEFRERNLSAYAVQLIGDGLSLGARYRLSEAQLETRLPLISDGAIGLSGAEQSERAVLHQISLSLNYQHTSGVFGQWESLWHHQHNSGDASPSRPGDDFVQHNFWLGYRFPRRHAEIRLGLLNITDQDYRLNPLNTYNALPRNRTVAASLRLNF